MPILHCQSREPGGHLWRRLALAICWCVAFGSLVACGGGGGEANDAVPAGSAVLQWSASSDTRVAGYRVYYGTSPRSYEQAKGSGISAGASAIFTVANLPAGRTYYFAVTSVDAAGNESDYSAEASKSIQ